MIALPLFALAAVPIPSAMELRRPVVVKTEMQASVTIMSAEPIEPQPSHSRMNRSDRQYRTRGDLPLVEFY